MWRWTSGARLYAVAARFERYQSKSYLGVSIIRQRLKSDRNATRRLRQDAPKVLERLVPFRGLVDPKSQTISKESTISLNSSEDDHRIIRDGEHSIASDPKAALIGNVHLFGGFVDIA